MLFGCKLAKGRGAGISRNYPHVLTQIVAVTYESSCQEEDSFPTEVFAAKSARKSAWNSV